MKWRRKCLAGWSVAETWHGTGGGTEQHHTPTAYGNSVVAKNGVVDSCGWGWDVLGTLLGRFWDACRTFLGRK